MGLNKKDWERRRKEKAQLEEAVRRLVHEETRGSEVEQMGLKEKRDKEREVRAKNRYFHDEWVLERMQNGAAIDELDAVRKWSDGRTDNEVAREFLDGLKEKKNVVRITRSDEYGLKLSDGGWISRDHPDYNRFVEELQCGMDFIEVNGDIKDGSYYSVKESGVELLDGFGDGYGGTKGYFAFDPSTAEENSLATVKTDFSGKVDVTIPDAIYMRLVKVVQELSKEGLEVGGLLKMDYVDGKLTITDYNLLPQEVGGADFEIKEPAMAAFMIEHLDDPDFAKWRAWWHSHHRMGLFWSGTDDDQFRKLVEGSGQYKDAFGIVFVESGDFRARYDVRTPFGVAMVDNLTVKILRAGVLDERKIEAEMKQVITENVTKPKYESLDYSYGSREKYSDIRVADVLIDNSSLWDDITLPYDAGDVLELVEMHRKSTLWKRWSLEFECMVWGIDDKKLRAAMRKVDEKLRAERKAQGKRGRKKKQKYDMLGGVL